MKSNHWIKRGGIALGLCVLLALAALLPALAASRDTAEPEPAAEKSTPSQPETALKSAASDAVDKSETVYVQAEADGSPQEITVETILRNPGGSGGISDATNLSGIKNTEGDESFTEQNGVLLWENHGEDIRYEGKSQAQLPVSVSVSYYLDGVNIEPEALAGQSGRVRIRFDYENHTSETVTVDGEELTVCVPFTALSAAVLPEDVFSNIEVTNGKLLSMDGQSVAVGLAFPGLADSLEPGAYEPTEELELPDYVEISADVEQFELDFTATILTPGLFSGLEEEDLSGIDDLIADMAELTDASGELAEGADTLAGGLDEFRSYLTQYLSGVSAINTGSAALTEGLAQLNAQKAQLADGAAALQSGLEELNTALSQLSLPSAGEGSTSGAEGAAEQLAADAQTLAAALGAVQSALGELQSYQAQVTGLVSAANGALAGADAAAAARQAAQEALDGAGLSEEQKAQILDSIAASGSIASLQGQIDSARNTLDSIPALDLPDLTASLSSISATVEDMGLQLELLQGYSASISGLADQLGGMGDTLDALKEGVGTLTDGSRQLTAGLTAFHQGIQQLYDGASTLSSGAAELAGAGSALNSGLDAIAEGSDALADGMATFDEEGIQALDELAGDELAALTRRIRALKEADGRYANFGGIRDGMTGSVRFIIETAEISF